MRSPCEMTVGGRSFEQAFGRCFAVCSATGSAIGMLVLSAVLAGALVVAPPALSKDPVVPTRVVDAATVVMHLAEEIEAGQRTTVARLERIGFADEVAEITRLDTAHRYTFSARTLIETLRMRAELAEPSIGGDRLLRVLYDDAAGQSAQLASDPAFGWLRERFTAADMGLNARPIAFAPLSALTDAPTPVSAPVARAIDKLADNLAAPHLSRVKFSLVRRLNLGSDALGTFERAIARSGDRRGVIAELLREHAPPPVVERAIRQVLGDVKRGSAVLAMDVEMASLIDDLSQAERLPERYRTYAEVEDAIGSRARQHELAHAVGLPGKVPSAAVGLDDVLSSVGVPTAGPGGGTGGDRARPMPPRMTVARSNALAGSYKAYTSRAFSGVSRAYRSAIRLPSLARGIAVGGALRIDVEQTPVRAVWMPNDADPRFGRLFVQLEAVPTWTQKALRLAGREAESERLFAASRVMFTDSFTSAASLLETDHDDVGTPFREGDLLILMSMDPEKEVEGEHAGRVREFVKEIEAEASKVVAKRSREWELLSSRTVDETELGRIADYLNEKYRQTLKELDMQYAFASNELPRGVVLHPSVHGREMAWSTVRVDFWFNDLDALSEESALVNGGAPLPERLAAFDISDASTWQFYELDRTIKLDPGPSGALRISVVPDTSDDGPAAFPSHASSLFGVSVFAYTENPAPGSVAVAGESDVFRLPNLEAEAQPVLNWLSGNHHDFMRLNDYSEALAILRWMRGANTPVLVADMDGDAPPLATPDRVYVSDGPGLPE